MKGSADVRASAAEGLYAEYCTLRIFQVTKQQGVGYSSEGISLIPPKLKAAVIASVEWPSGISGCFLAV